MKSGISRAATILAISLATQAADCDSPAARKAINQVMAAVDQYWGQNAPDQIANLYDKAGSVGLPSITPVAEGRAAIQGFFHTNLAQLPSGSIHNMQLKHVSNLGNACLADVEAVITAPGTDGTIQQLGRFGGVWVLQPAHGAMRILAARAFALPESS
jgi:hypothetical protein